MPSTEPCVRIASVRVGYPGGGFALRVDRLEVAVGETVALVGPSGCGKSTILKSIAGLLDGKADRSADDANGELTVLGERPSELSEAERRRFRRERLGVSFQPFAMLDALDVTENVLLPLYAGAGFDGANTARGEARRLLAALGIERYANCMPAKLSHGERQRVALCRALVTRRPLVLLDEPTASLDPPSKRSAMEFAANEVRSYGGSLLVVTHDLDALAAFDRVVDVRECSTLLASRELAAAERDREAS